MSSSTSKIQPMSDAHSRPSGDAPEPLYDVNIPTPTHAERARTLVAQISTGTLCTLAIEPEGYPYGSFVTVAFDEGQPGLPHQRTRRTHQEPGAGSPRVPAGGRERLPPIRSPTAASRCSVRARASRGTGAAPAPRSWPRIRTPRTTPTFATSGSGSCTWSPVRYIGGYGRMSWISKADWQAAEPDPLAPSAAGIIAHMNADHADAMVLYCKAFSKATDITSAKMTGDRPVWLRDVGEDPEGPRPVRLAFAKPVSTPEEVRAALIAMVKDARRKLG